MCYIFFNLREKIIIFFYIFFKSQPIFILKITKYLKSAKFIGLLWLRL